MRTRVRLFAIPLIAASLLAMAACSPNDRQIATGGDMPNLNGSNLGGGSASDKALEVPRYGAQLDGNLKLGLIVSSAGPGKDFQPLAAGALVAPLMIVDQKMRVISQDDQGTPDGARTAMNTLINSGCSGIIYGSVGPQIAAGLEVAKAKNTPVVLPFDSSDGLTSMSPNAYVTALPNPEVPQKIAGFTKSERKYSRYAIVYDRASPYAVSMQAYTTKALTDLGVPPVVTMDFGPEDVSAGLRNKLKATLPPANPDAIFVLADASNTFRVLTEWFVLGLSPQIIVSPYAAVPTLSALDVNAISPPVRPGTLSSGMAGGPWNPTPAVIDFYAKRNEAKNKLSNDVSWASPASADAALILVAAAERGKGVQAQNVVMGMKGLQFKGIGADYDFKTQVGVTMDDYAVTAYTREESAKDTYVGKQFPDPRSAGGFWVAVPGSAPSLKNEGKANP